MIPAESEPTVRRYRMSRAHLAALGTGRSDAEAIQFLADAERSWRLVALWTVLDACVGVPGALGPLPPIERAWELIVRALEASATTVESLLMYPSVGIWAAHALRRIEGSVPAAGRETRAPLWTDLGYLHAVAASAAVSTGIDFDIDVPTREGEVVLPEIGWARLPADEPWATARISDGGGRPSVHAPGGASIDIRGPSWNPVRRIRTGPAGRRLDIVLDDHDPFRDLRGPARVTPLPHHEERRWQDLAAVGWRLLDDQQPALTTAMARRMRALAPLPALERFRPLSASGAEGFGSALISRPYDPEQLAVTLVHEFQHNKLGALTHLLALTADGSPRRFYAPWRDDPRPVGALLQGAYAFSGITEFWQERRRRVDPAARAAGDFEFALWRRQTRLALGTLHTCGLLTPAGHEFVDTLRRRSDAWLDDEVPGTIERAADLAATDHHAMWRGHHLRSVPDAVDAVVADLLAGRPAGPAVWAQPRQAEDPRVPPLDTRTVLQRYRLADPATFAGMAERPDGPARVVPGATTADLTLVAGDHQGARQGYTRQLGTDSRSVAAWVGLGLACRAGDDRVSAVALLEYPELVVAVAASAHARIAGPLDAGRLAAWLGAALTTGGPRS